MPQIWHMELLAHWSGAAVAAPSSRERKTDLSVPPAGMRTSFCPEQAQQDHYQYLTQYRSLLAVLPDAILRPHHAATHTSEGAYSEEEEKEEEEEVPEEEKVQVLAQGGLPEPFLGITQYGQLTWVRENPTMWFGGRHLYGL